MPIVAYANPWRLVIIERAIAAHQRKRGNHSMNKRHSLRSMGWRRSTRGFLSAQTPEEELTLDPADDTTRLHVSDSVDLVTMMGYDLGIRRWSMRIDRATMILKRSDEHEAALRVLIGEMEDRASPFYPDRFTDEDFAITFGLPKRDIDKVVSWMRLKELESLKVSPARTSIVFSGNLLVLEAAFRTEFHRYRFDGKEYLANAYELSVPGGFRARDKRLLQPQPCGDLNPAARHSTVSLRKDTPNNGPDI
jgi:Pro-kumamolisin, activation domain